MSLLECLYTEIMHCHNWDLYTSSKLTFRWGLRSTRSDILHANARRSSSSLPEKRLRHNRGVRLGKSFGGTPLHDHVFNGNWCLAGRFKCIRS